MFAYLFLIKENSVIHFHLSIAIIVFTAFGLDKKKYQSKLFATINLKYNVILSILEYKRDEKLVPVVQSIVSITSSLRGQLSRCFTTDKVHRYFLLK